MNLEQIGLNRIVIRLNQMLQKILIPVDVFTLYIILSVCSFKINVREFS